MHTSKKILVIIGFLSLLATYRVAIGNVNSCQNITTSQQVYECSKAKKHLADSLPNKEYTQLLQNIKLQYKSDSKLEEEYIQKIKISQRAWIKLRDANCAIESFEIVVGSQAYETTYNNCIAKETNQRIDYLKSIVP